MAIYSSPTIFNSIVKILTDAQDCICIVLQNFIFVEQLEKSVKNCFFPKVLTKHTEKLTKEAIVKDKIHYTLPFSYSLMYMYYVNHIHTSSYL